MDNEAIDSITAYLVTLGGLVKMDRAYYHHQRAVGAALASNKNYQVKTNCLRLRARDKMTATVKVTRTDEKGNKKGR